jgi:hypothetical protein
VAAAGVSAAVTIMMLGMLLGRPAPRPVPSVRAVAVKVFAPKPPTTALPAPVAQGRPARPMRHDAPVTRAPLPPAPMLEPAPPEPAQAVSEPIRSEVRAAAGAPSAEPVVPAASAALRLDAATLRAAIAQSKGVVQRPTAADSPAARLSAGIAGAGKNGCLASNEGGSLLSLPLIAYAAATGQCK